MRVHVARHGEAVEPQVDPSRPLSERGRADVARIAEGLRDRGVRVAAVRHSPKRRAVETARLLAAAIGPDVALEEDPRLVPDGDPGEQLPELEAVDDDTLLVGHLPHVADLTRLLVSGPRSDLPVVFSPGTVVSLRRRDDGRFEIEAVAAP